MSHVTRRDLEALARQLCECLYGTADCHVYQEFEPRGWVWFFTRHVDGLPDYDNGIPVGESIQEAAATMRAMLAVCENEFRNN